MVRLEDDREMALKGYTNTSPGWLALAQVAAEGMIPEALRMLPWHNS
jgi:hypothetical protein